MSLGAIGDGAFGASGIVGGGSGLAVVGHVVGAVVEQLAEFGDAGVVCCWRFGCCGGTGCGRGMSFDVWNFWWEVGGNDGVCLDHVHFGCRAIDLHERMYWQTVQQETQRPNARDCKYPPPRTRYKSVILKEILKRRLTMALHWQQGENSCIP